MSTSPWSDFTVAGKAVLITGATAGIGRHMAAGFLAAGAAVAVNGRKADRVAAAVAELQGSAPAAEGGRPRLLGVTADVRDFAAVEAMVERVCETFGRIDVLVNNAGGTFRAPAEEISPNGWQAVLATNLTGPFHCCKAVFPRMRAQGGGKIVNIGSISGFSANVKGAHYGAAKRGLESLTETLAAEWARYGILVNCVAPGPILTEASSWVKPDLRAAREKTVPLGRIGTPQDVLAACLYLASDACRYVTGATLRVDGGPRLGYVWE